MFDAVGVDSHPSDFFTYPAVVFQIHGVVEHELSSTRWRVDFDWHHPCAPYQDIVLALLGDD
jgi:hypothetical protein